ncbi:MAG TPA: glycosyltransferase [Ktedonobacterales bacterium]|nr:glycosyltransferase [Ktedonobacterales bacterium]
MRGNGKRVLFAVGHWGLGHATRDLPLIRGLLAEGCEVIVGCDGPPLEVLRRELAGACEVLRLPGSPIPLASTPLRFYTRYTLLLLPMWRSKATQHAEVERLARQRHLDLVISDNRYGCYSRHVPSYLIAHGIRFIPPFGDWWLGPSLEYFNYRAFAPFTRLIVPDFAVDSLSGALSHDLRFVAPERLAYIGPLSSVRRRPVAEDLDYFITISGPEPQRGMLEQRLLEQAPLLPGHGVMALGRPGAGFLGWHGNCRVYGYLDRAAQEETLNRARLVVSRSGYSTLMELAELGKRALLIPTPGQTEQEYLGRYHQQRGAAPMVEQSVLQLASDMQRTRTGFRGFQTPWGTERSVAHFLDVVLGPAAEPLSEKVRREPAPPEPASPLC